MKTKIKGMYKTRTNSANPYKTIYILYLQIFNVSSS